MSKSRKLCISLIVSVLISIMLLVSMFGCAGDQMLMSHNNAEPPTEYVESEPRTIFDVLTPWLVWIGLLASGLIFFWRMEKRRVVETNDS
jgi:hypothetical protein